MTYRVEASVRAEADLDAILSWLLSDHAGESAIRWFNGMHDAVLSLSELPHRCNLAPEDSAFPFEVRQLLYGNRMHKYRILFTIEGETVTILHIRHGRRLPLIP
jgi:plasmid stabilization system protein ParE